MRSLGRIEEIAQEVIAGLRLRCGRQASALTCPEAPEGSTYTTQTHGIQLAKSQLGETRGSPLFKADQKDR